MHKSNIYRNIFMKILEEDSVAGDGGSFGDTQPTATFQSGDNYATGDSRNIFGGFPVKVQK